MGKNEKPTPVDRKLYSDNIKEPYKIPEQKYQQYNESIKDPKDINYGNVNFIRSNETSSKGKIEKPIEITLEDHDTAIINYIKNNILNTVLINGGLIQVPVIYSSPERWKSMQKDGFFRDKEGKAMVPIISIKRDSYEKNRSLGNKLDANNPNNIQYFKLGYTKSNSYDNFSALNNVKPKSQFITSITPDYIDLKYSISIFTDYMEHMNKIIEAFTFASDSYWGEKNKFKFRASIDSFPSNIHVESGQDRAIKSELVLRVWGYMIPKTPNQKLVSPTKISYGVNRVIFKENIE